MSPKTTPIRLDLKRDKGLEIEWQDGIVSFYSIDYLRGMCPCAKCKEVRKGEPAPAAAPKSSRLTILPGNYAQPLRALEAELVGNYALKIEWSDQHGSGIYSFEYLRQIAPSKDGFGIDPPSNKV